MKKLLALFLSIFTPKQPSLCPEAAVSESQIDMVSYQRCDPAPVAQTT